MMKRIRRQDFVWREKSPKKKALKSVRTREKKKKEKLDDEMNDAHKIGENLCRIDFKMSSNLRCRKILVPIFFSLHNTHIHTPTEDGVFHFVFFFASFHLRLWRELLKMSKDIDLNLWKIRSMAFIFFLSCFRASLVRFLTFPPENVF